MGKHHRDRSRSPKHKKKKSKHSSHRNSSPESTKMSFEDELQKLKDERRFCLFYIITFFYTETFFVV